MKIKEISTEQFAGINDISFSFDDGINVVYGKNEAGKSTLVNLISRTLFQNSKINNKKDKEFKTSCFPLEKKGKEKGDYIDGTVVIESESGRYKITKEWGDDPKSKLSTPSGTAIKNQNEIDSRLKDILRYNEGVYNEMLLSPQKMNDENLRCLMNASKRTDSKIELSKAVSKAFAESDGISIDAISEEIDNKIADLAGKYWDIENECPIDKSKRYQKSVGEVLKAWYDKEDVEKDAEKLDNLETKLDKCSTDFNELEKDVQEAEQELNEFNKIEVQLNSLNDKREKAERHSKDIDRYTKIIKKWPDIEKNLNKANELKSERDNRKVLDKYNSAKEINDRLKQMCDELNKISSPNEKEIKEVKSIERKISGLENKLCGMNLSVNVKMLADKNFVIKSLRTGETLRAEGKNFEITEAASIEIPGVMEMTLSPLNVNSEEISTEITELNSQKIKTLKKYQCESISDLEELAKRYSVLDNKKELEESSLEHVLFGNKFEELEEQALALKDIRSVEEIDDEIESLCDDEDIDRFIGSTENELRSYIDEFDTAENLQKKIKATQKELDKANELIKSAEKIPDKYQDIEDSEDYKTELEDNLQDLREKLSQARDDKVTVQRDLENFGISSDELQEKMEKTNREYGEKLRELDDWVYIKAVLQECKDELSGNPLQELTDNFNKYLEIISDNTVSSDLKEEGMADFQISSNDNLLDFDHLSNGTKETVYLAFRLAVLDQLFPEGGGIIVLDDPLNDMDMERVEQSCKLIKDCAQRHQVIFLTCREEYIDILGGKLIKFRE